jgi:manganese transport protein
LSERTVFAAREVLGGRGGARAYLAFAGPAVVASIAYMDPGNFATNIQAGAKYGYTLLWVVLLANMVAMLFQALSAKLGIVTGRNLAEMCRDQFAKPCGRCGSSARLPPWQPTSRSSSAEQSACPSYSASLFSMG